MSVQKGNTHAHACTHTYVELQHLLRSLLTEAASVPHTHWVKVDRSGRGLLATEQYNLPAALPLSEHVEVAEQGPEQ